MSNDLMELVNECLPPEPLQIDKIKNAAALKKAQELDNYGFHFAAGTIRGKIEPEQKMQAIAYHRYIVITPLKIQAFLDRKARAYNDSQPAIKVDKKTSGVSSMIESFYSFHNPSMHTDEMTQRVVRRDVPATADHMGIRFGSYTMHNQIMREGTIGNFAWKECEIQRYNGIPPQSALDALQLAKERKVFDYFTVAKVEGVKDPLLLGVLQNNEDRFFLSQWGDDVCLDDVI